MSEHHPPIGPLENPEVAHEQSDVNVRGILTVAGGLVVVCFICYVVVSLTYVDLRARNEKAKHLTQEGPTSMAQELNGVAGPHLEQFERIQGQPMDLGPSKPPTPSELAEQVRIQQAMDRIVQQNLLPARSDKTGEPKLPAPR